MKKWKILFFLLLSVNLIIIVYIFSLISFQKDQTSPNPVKLKKEEYAIFEVQSDKETITHLVNEYLQKEVQNQPLSYQIDIQDEVILYGTLIAFGRELQLTLSFLPEVTNEGNVLLNVQNLSVGKLSLPISYVLNYVNKHYELPEEVAIEPDKARVLVQITDISLRNNYKVKLKSINLKENKISAELYIPYQTIQ